MFRRILIAYDGSEPSDKAFRYALELAARFDAPLDVVAVVRPPDFGSEVADTTALVDSGRHYFQQRFHDLEQAARQAGVSLHPEQTIGQPAECILRHAQQIAADVIVIGHRGKSLVERWLTGSTAKQVMGYAHCPVLIVR